MIPFTLRNNSRSKRIRISVHRDGKVVVTKPKRVAQYVVDRFIQSNIEWIQKKIEAFSQLPKKMTPKGTREEYEKYKEEARVLARRRLEHFNASYQLKWNNIAIKNTSSRWGSCSTQKNLNFSYKIALLPQELADYIIVHELCHLQEMNHSASFWNLVAQTIPNHRELRNKIKNL